MAGPQVGIRPATPDDIPRILAFIRELAAYEREPDAVVADEDALRAQLFGPRPAAEVLVAEVAGVAAGFAVLPQLQHLARPSRALGRGPVRAAGLPWTWHRQGADGAVGGDRRGARVRPLRMDGWTGTRRPSGSTAASARSGWTAGPCSGWTAKPCTAWPRRPWHPERMNTSSGPENRDSASGHGQPVGEMLDPTEKESLTEVDGAPPPPPVEQKVRRAGIGALPMALLRRFLDADVITQAAALAFYAALSLAPLMLLLLWLTASSPGIQQAVVGQIEQLVGPEAGGVAATVIGNARGAPDTGSLAGWWSIGLLLVGATAVFAQLQDALNRIFRTDATALDGLGAWLRKRLLSFGILLALAFLLLVSMTVTTALQMAFRGLGAPQPALAATASLLVYVVGFALMFRFLPDRRVRWRLALLGGALTALLFMLGRAVIAWYLERAPSGAAYGTMGALMLTMLWVYYASMILFAGALVTATIDERLGARKP